MWGLIPQQGKLVIILAGGALLSFPLQWVDASLGANIDGFGRIALFTAPAPVLLLVWMLIGKNVDAWRIPCRYMFIANWFPDLNGLWDGYITTTHNDFEEKFPVVFRIKQTWAQVTVTYENPDPYNGSRSQAVLCEPGKENGVPCLRMLYHNTNLNHGPSDSDLFMGASELRYLQSDGSLSGLFCTNRGWRHHRHTAGSLHLVHRKDVRTGR